MSDYSYYAILGSTTFIVGVLAAAFALYMSGEMDNLVEWAGKKYFKAEAKAEEKAMEKMESDKAQNFLAGQLKKNPLVPEGEVDQLRQGFGKDLGGLGKF